MILVKGTREGLNGQKTSTGYVITPDVPFVALPSTAARYQWIMVYSPTTKQTCRALVLDVGPWNETDHPYVFQLATSPFTGQTESPTPTRPQAESGVDHFGRTTNGAGIDLSEKVRSLLGLPPTSDNETVGWWFV